MSYNIIFGSISFINLDTRNMDVAHTHIDCWMLSFPFKTDLINTFFICSDFCRLLNLDNMRCHATNSKLYIGVFVCADINIKDFAISPISH